MNQIEIKLPSDPRFLKVVRSSISHVGEICRLSDEECNAVTIAVDEAISNVIKHTYNGDNQQLIVVSIDIMDDRLQIILRDFGKKVDPKTIKPRNLDDIRPGGLGVHLIKTTMDIVQYDNSLDVGNQLTMTKYLPGKTRQMNASS